MRLDRLLQGAIVWGALAGAAGLAVFVLVGGLGGALAGGAIVVALSLAAARVLSRLGTRAPEAESGPAPVSAELLGSLSHEIRTPLNGILGMTQLLFGLRPTAQQREYLEMLKSSGESLLRLINDLLDYSRFQAGKLSLESEAFHLRRFVRQTVKTLSPQAHLKGLELGYWVEPDVPQVVRGDPGRLRQVLANLVINSTKFTDRGEVFVEVSLAPATEGARFRFAVRDTGIGIAETGREALFEAFAQGPTASERAAGGLGLGLAISSRIVERMGGELTVESEVGRGSTFTFDVPFVVVEERGESDGQPPEAIRGARVLVVDDSPMQQRILSALLAEWGCEVEAVADFGAAIASVQKSLQVDEPFSLLLLDSSLGDADSWYLAKKIHEISPVPGILMTLAHEYVDPDALRAHGFLGHLTKPIAPSHLSRAIEIIQRGARVDKAEDVQTHTMDRLVLDGLRVLLAEDHPVNRTVAVRSLERAGSVVVAVEDGVQAVEVASRERFDVLLLDLEMPQMDGYQVVREIRDREKATGEHLPIIAITAHSKDEDQTRCLDLGMDDFLLKPLDEVALVDALQRLVRPAVASPSAAASRVVPSGDVFDPERALARANGDRALFQELCELFIEETPSILTDIARAIADGDWIKVERSAHRLKGALLTLSAGRSAEAALDLENVARAGDAARCRAGFARLQVELQDLQAILSAQLDVKTR